LERIITSEWMQTKHLMFRYIITAKLMLQDHISFRDINHLYNTIDRMIGIKNEI